MSPPDNSFGGIGERRGSRDHVVQELVPSSAWTEDSDAHYILVDLPGYKKAEARLQVDDSGLITASGERLVDCDKYEYFEQTYQAPKNSDINNITGKFTGEILIVTVPKQAVEDKKEEEASPASSSDERSDQADDIHTENEDQESSKTDSSVDGLHNHEEILQKPGQNALPFMEMPKRNKWMLLAAVLAFALGLMVSRKFPSTWD